jgi:hypothetical protein
MVWMAAVVLMGMDAAAMELYVSPKGNDAADGSKEKPLASMEGAVSRLRALRAEGKAEGNVLVFFAGGEYVVERPVEFLPEDSGTSFVAAKGEKPVFFGGKRLPPFKAGADGVWRVQVGKDFRFEQLYVNGTRATRARSPNSGYGRGKASEYFYMQAPAPYGLDPLTGEKLADMKKRAFMASPQDVAPLRNLSAEELADTVVTVFHAWEVSRARVQAVDADGRVVVAATTPWEFFYWRDYLPRYHIENFAAALDEPGEWFLSRDGELSYIPRKGETIGKTVAVAPVTSGFLSFKGDPAQKKHVERLAFKDLTFEYTGFKMTGDGWGNGQASISQGACVEGNGVRTIFISDCTFAHIGNHGIWFKKDCRDCVVMSCHLYDLGGGAMYVGDSKWSQQEIDLVTNHIVIRNNILHEGGRLFHGCTGVWIGHASDVEVTHNDIADFYYTGISIGWTWGYQPTVTHRNTLAYKHIHHLGWGVMSDMGGIYSLGNLEGTAVYGNVIHHVASYDYTGRGGWGLYTDEGSANMVFENNLIHHTKTGNIHQHYGRDNTFRNNILVESADGQIQRSRLEKEHTTIIVTNNVICWANPSAMIWRGYANGDPYMNDVVFDHNLYWNPNGFATNAFHYGSWEAWLAAGHDAHSIVADPMFVDAAKEDYRLKPGSPAFKLGFKAFDPSKAGVQGDAAWKKKAVKTYPEVVFAKTPERYGMVKRLSENFDNVPPGKPFPNVITSVEGKGDSIAVTDEAAFSGPHSLKVLDAPGLQHRFNPHFFFKCNFTNAALENTFVIRAQEGVDVCAEWREYKEGNSYMAGPCILFQNGKVLARAAGETREVADLPPDTWAKIRVWTEIGDKADGTWSVSVEPQGQPAKEATGLRFAHPEFRAMHWLGFSSQTDRAIAYYLDDFFFGEK